MHLRRLSEASSIAVPFLLAALLSGCPQQGIVCRTGTERCGEGCADLTSDERNCGGCGIACTANQVCTSGSCACRSGAVLCDGFCVITASDAKHCGGCNQPCQTGEVCEQGTCKQACTLGSSLRCGNSCVDPKPDSANCGACGWTCATGSRCVGGACASDVLAACFTSGQVVPVDGESEVRGQATALGSGPSALAAYGHTVLAADGVDRKLYQAEADAGVWEQLSPSAITGAVPNQVVVDAPYVYVLNAETGSLQVLHNLAADGGTQGKPLATVAELPLGANTWPEGAVKVGNALWIPLYGGFGPADADAGQAVVKVQVDPPSTPEVKATVDLRSVDLKAFDGGAPVARPWAITANNGFVYVALNNLNPTSYAVEGPGLLARIDPDAGAVDKVIDLGASQCLNPQWVAPLGSSLVVSCGGKVTYNLTTYAVESVEAAGVVVVDATDTPSAAWASGCPADAGLADGGTTCPPFLPGRFAVRDGRVYLADQNAGRLAVLELTDGGLVERRGPTAAAGPIQACTPDMTTGIANVSDVLSLP